MLPTFPFKLVAPHGLVFDGPVKQVVAVDPLGEFAVLAQHVNFVAQLVADVVTIELPNGGLEHYLLPNGGLAEVKDGAMTIAAETQKFEAPETALTARDVVSARRRIKDLQIAEPRSVVCPETNRRAQIRVVREPRFVSFAGVARVVDCANWPEHRGCEQTCLSRSQ